MFRENLGNSRRVVHGTMKIAICLYGQFRTGLYCAPYIKSCYEFGSCDLDIEVDYFCFTKDYNTNGRVLNDKKYGEITPFNNYDDLEKAFDIYKPKEKMVFKKEHEGYPITNFPHPNLFSIMMSIELKKDYEEEHGFKYDYCFCQRFDVLILPKNIALMIMNLGDKERFIYTHLIERFPLERNSLGIGDFWFGGDNMSLDLLSSGITPLFSKAHIGCGANVAMYDILMANNIYPSIPQPYLLATPVRPEANLELDVMDSFYNHHDFFINNHPGNINKEWQITPKRRRL